MSAPTHASTPPDLFTLHDLPARWRQKRIFTFADTRFDGGARFLNAWRRWRADDARCDRLHVAAIGTLADLDAKPDDDSDPLAAQLARDAGRVVLTLAIGDADDGLSKLRARVDAFRVPSRCIRPSRRQAHRENARTIRGR